MQYNNPDPQDTSQEAIDRLKSNRGINLAATASKRSVLRGIGKLTKAAIAGIKMAVTTLIGILGPMAVFIGIILALVLLLFIGIYGGMTKETILTDAVAQASDIGVEKYATNRAEKANIYNTWVVPGEGSWHEQRIQQENKALLFEKYKESYNTTFTYDNNGQTKVNNLGYEGEDMPGWKFLGRLADNEGKDLQLINYWGDVYAPILFDSLQHSNENLMQNEEFRNNGFQEAGYELKPYFYYKASTITITSVNSKGESTTTTNDIYLLVEAYTIRGHLQYHYRWETKETGNTTITKEVLDNTLVIDNGRQYLTQYLKKRLKLDNDEDTTLAVDAVYEAMQGFTAKQEWAEWLTSDGINQSRIISSASIPIEYLSYLEEASNITGIPVYVLSAVIMKESSWDSNAVNENTGCFGLTQLNPQYWKAWASRYGFDPVADQWNPRAQIIIGARVLKDYIGTLIDWNSATWYENINFRAALAKYGGYGNDVQAAEEYIDDIVTKAKSYLQPISFPVAGYGLADITTPYAYRINPITHVYSFHGGIDIGCREGSEVDSVSSGMVTEMGKAGQGKWGVIYGNYIVITDMNYKYLYAHLSKINVTKDQIVTPGMAIGLSGNTGQSTGAHLHFGMSVIGGDPKSYINTVNPISILQVD